MGGRPRWDMQDSMDQDHELDGSYPVHWNDPTCHPEHEVESPRQPTATRSHCEIAHPNRIRGIPLLTHFR